MGCSSSSHRNVASPIEQVIILSHSLATTLLRCGYVPLLQLNPCLSICFQAENKAIAQDDKSSIARAPDHVRLVVNATSQSQVSSNPILGTEAIPGMNCKFQKNTCAAWRVVSSAAQVRTTQYCPCQSTTCTVRSSRCSSTLRYTIAFKSSQLT